MWEGFYKQRSTYNYRTVSSLHDTVYFPALHLKCAFPMGTLSAEPENKRLYSFDTHLQCVP